MNYCRRILDEIWFGMIFASIIVGVYFILIVLYSIKGTLGTIRALGT
jgi:hypothetical protein